MTTSTSFEKITTPKAKFKQGDLIKKNEDTDNILLVTSIHPDNSTILNAVIIHQKNLSELHSIGLPIVGLKASNYTPFYGDITLKSTP